MKERPMLFSGDMVRAILDERKTQTRRVIKAKKPFYYIQCGWYGKHPGGGWHGCDADPVQHNIPPGAGSGFKCPFGQPGDRLWVKETWYQTTNRDFSPGKIVYKADGWQFEKYPSWKPSIHMPRWASRLTLLITDIRVERLQDISEESIIAEGCPNEYLLGKNWFIPMWDAIYQKQGYGFDVNPWVWVIDFKKLEVEE